MITVQEAIEIVNDIKSQKQSSNLGFFSKPYLYSFKGENWIVKSYHPIAKGAEKIIQQHDDYCVALNKTGISVPFTQMLSIPEGRKKRLLIFQKAYDVNCLYRGEFEEAKQDRALELLTYILDECMLFWTNKPKDAPLGFHPTSRNYAIVEEKMHYFDTFPPMNMSQKDINRLILKMAPFPSLLKALVPNKAINRVSDEYYDIVKMLKGIVGSACRMHPERAEVYIQHAKEWTEKCALAKADKEAFIKVISDPPRLSWIWRSIRKISGNEGKPNL